MFKIAKMRTLKERPTEEYEITASEAVVLGEALVLTSGKLTKCGATATPEFIAVGEGTGVVIPVIRVMEDDTFETTFADDGSAIVVGDKVTLHTDGLQVTGTKTSGVFTVTEKIGDGTAGTKVQGMFRR